MTGRGSKLPSMKTTDYTTPKRRRRVRVTCPPAPRKTTAPVVPAEEVPVRRVIGRSTVPYKYEPSLTVRVMSVLERDAAIQAMERERERQGLPLEVTTTIEEQVRKLPPAYQGVKPVTQSVHVWEIQN